MIFAKRLCSAGHSRQFLIVNAAPQGWEAREEEDDHVIRCTRLTDWHRVEQAILRFGILAVELEQAGWIETQA